MLGYDSYNRRCTLKQTQRIILHVIFPCYWKGVSVSTIKTYAAMAMITREKSTLSTSFLAAISLPVWNKVMKPK
jgi:hypothetical protein